MLYCVYVGRYIGVVYIGVVLCLCGVKGDANEK